VPTDDLLPERERQQCAHQQQCRLDRGDGRTRPGRRPRLHSADGHGLPGLPADGAGTAPRADASVRQALRFAAEREAELLPAVGRVRIGVGELFYERDDLDTSERELTLGMELVERAGEWRYW
jgi:hypothetical protein